MAKLLISCDDYIFRHRGRYYFKNREWADFYQRYLRVFDALRIVNRCIDEEELKPGRIAADDPRIEIRPLPIFHGPAQYLTRYAATGRAMRGAVEGCDAALLRLPSTVAQRLSRQVLRKGIPYAVEVVFDACDGAETASNPAEKLLWRIIDRQMRRICAGADGVSCVTEHYLQRRYFSVRPGHFESHYSTLALDRSFFSAPRKYPARRPMRIAHVDMQLSLHGRKGTDIILQALAELKRRGIVVEVRFAGDDWDHSTERIAAYARKLGIGGQVSFPGFLSRQQLNDFLDDSDLFVLPTKAEGLPRVIIEAMAKALPTVTTPASGNPELIPEHYLVGFSDVAALAERIEELTENPEAYERASAENFENSLQYEASILQERRDGFYRSLLQKTVNRK